MIINISIIAQSIKYINALILTSFSNIIHYRSNKNVIEIINKIKCENQYNKLIKTAFENKNRKNEKNLNANHIKSNKFDQKHKNLIKFNEFNCIIQDNDINSNIIKFIIYKRNKNK